MSLLDTYPRLGLAALQARWEMDVTGEYPGQRFCEIIRAAYRRARCCHCGGPEHRHVITSRILVGPNAGTVQTHYRMDRSCRHGPTYLSNYRRPWEGAPL